MLMLSGGGELSWRWGSGERKSMVGALEGVQESQPFLLSLCLSVSFLSGYHWLSSSALLHDVLPHNRPPNKWDILLWTGPSETLSQNKPFLLINRLSLVVCHSQGKLTKDIHVYLYRQEPHTDCVWGCLSLFLVPGPCTYQARKPVLNESFCPSVQDKFVLTSLASFPTTREWDSEEHISLFFSYAYKNVHSMYLWVKKYICV